MSIQDQFLSFSDFVERGISCEARTGRNHIPPTTCTHTLALRAQIKKKPTLHWLLNWDEACTTPAARILSTTSTHVCVARVWRSAPYFPSQPSPENLSFSQEVLDFLAIPMEGSLSPEEDADARAWNLPSLAWLRDFLLFLWFSSHVDHPQGRNLHFWKNYGLHKLA